MAYKIKQTSSPKFWAATMTITIPEYSADLYHRALSSMKGELSQMGIPLLDPEYNYTTTDEHDQKIELIDLELVVGVEEAGIDTDIIKFKEISEEEDMIRITSGSFTDVHTGIAEWMHENDFQADGSLRHVISDEAEYVYDCPFKPSDD